MIDVECRTELILRDAAGREASLSAAVPLLLLVSQTGSIAQAASAKGLSYRHAWGILRDIETRLGGALITKSRGRGSVLSELGEALSDCAAVQQAESRASYAETLLAFATRARWPLAAVAMASSSNLSPRIERLLSDRGFERSFAPAQRLSFDGNR